MSTDSLTNDNTGSTSLPAEVTDDSCTVKYIEIVPLASNTGGLSTRKCDSGDLSREVTRENLPVVKQELDDVSDVLLLFVLAAGN